MRKKLAALEKRLAARATAPPQRSRASSVRASESTIVLAKGSSRAAFVAHREVARQPAEPVPRQPGESRVSTTSAIATARTISAWLYFTGLHDKLRGFQTRRGNNNRAYT